MIWIWSGINWALENGGAAPTPPPQIPVKSYVKVYNVLDYGVVVNSTVDQGAAIRAVIAIVATNGGGIIYFPEGVYLTYAAIVITERNITLCGDGIKSQIKVPLLPAPIYPFTIIGVTKFAKNFCIRDLAIQGSTVIADQPTVSKIQRGITIGTNTAGTAYDLTKWTANGRIERVYFTSENGTTGIACPIQTQNQKSLTIRDCVVTGQVGWTSGYGYGFNLTGYDILAENNYFCPDIAGMSRHGLYISGTFAGDNSSNITLRGNYIERSQSEAITSNCGYQPRVRGVRIEGNTIYNCQSTLYSAGVQAGAIHIAGIANVRVTDNDIYNDATGWGNGHGVWVGQEQSLENRNENVIVTGNSMTGLEFCGVWISYADKFTVANNNFKNIGKQSPATAVNMLLSTDGRVFDNTTTLTDGTPLTANVYVNTTPPTPSDVVIGGNKIFLSGGSTCLVKVLNSEVGARIVALDENYKPLVRYSQSATPDVGGAVSLLVHNPELPVLITDLVNGIDQQVVTIRGYLANTKVQNNARLSLASYNDVCIRYGKTLTLMYDGAADRWLEVARGVNLENYGQPPSGQWLSGEVTWNTLNSTHTEAVGYVALNDGWAVSDDAIWTTGTAFYAGLTCYRGTNVYITTAGGTTGAIPPTHTAGAVSDGGVLWHYVGQVTKFARWGRLENTVARITNFSGNPSLDDTDNMLVYSTATGGGGLYLPYAVRQPGKLLVLHKTAGSAYITLIPVGADTINGSIASYQVTHSPCIVQCDGANWQVLSAPSIGSYDVGGNYTFQSVDSKYQKIRQISTVANTVTVPPNIFPIGDKLELRQCNTGATTLAAGAGVTLNSSTLVSSGRHCNFKLHQVALNVWDVSVGFS